MSELKNVFKHLNKEEVKLSSEKVELGAVDEWLSKLKEARQSFSEATKATESIKPQVSKAEKIWSKTAKQFIELSRELSKIEKQAKELGLKLPAEIAQQVKAMDRSTDAALARTKSLRTIENSL